MSVTEKPPLDEDGKEITNPDGSLIDAAAVRLRTSLGEFLVYKVIAGPVPRFALIDTPIDGDGDPVGPSVEMLRSPPVQDEFETTWPDPQDASVPEGEIHKHTLSMIFAQSPKYTYKVEVRRISGALKKELIWKVFESDSEEEEHFQSLRVETA